MGINIWLFMVEQSRLVACIPNRTCACVCLLDVRTCQVSWMMIYITVHPSLMYQKAPDCYRTTIIRNHQSHTPALGNDKSISYSWTDICFVWVEKPLEPISSIHSIHSESLYVLVVWIKPAFASPTVGGKTRADHLFLIYSYHSGEASVLERNSSTFMYY